VVWALGQEGEAGLWLRALGLFEGQRVMVLRRAPFGGPFHVRVGDAARGSGRSCAEFAIDPSLAAQITMEPRASGAP
jgi:Fe2+ transport system protein FeoA